MSIKIKNVNYTYSEGTAYEMHALKNINLEIPDGQFVVLIGTSGCGKTTTLKTINRLIEPDSGRILIDGKEIHEIDKVELRRHIGYVIQQIGLFPNMTVEQNMAFGLKIQRLSKAEINDRITEALAMVGLQDKADAYPAQLSGGQQQRVAIARALALHPDILCFDEPTSALDPELTGEVLRVLRDLADRKTTMIIVTHEMHFARDVADRIMFMDGGVVVEEGPARQLIDHPQEERTKQFLAHYSE